MKQVRIDAFCDFCMAEKNTYVASTGPHTIGLAAGEQNKVALRTIDSCDIHKKSLDGLAELVATWGAPVGKQPQSTAEPEPVVACELCTSKLQQRNYAAHLRLSHKLKSPAQPKKCPECSDYKSSEQVSMRQHRSKVHGYSVAKAMLQTGKSRKEPQT